MVNKKKIILAVLQGLFLLLILIPLFFVVIFQIPAVQTRAARGVVSLLENSIEGSMSIDRISVVLFNRVVAYDMTVTGDGGEGVWGDGDTTSYYNPGDTLAHVGKLSVTFSPFDLLGGDLRVRRVVVSGASFRLLTEAPDRMTNLFRIFRLRPPDIASERPKGNIPDLSADDVRLENSSLRVSNPFSAGVVQNGAELMNYRDIVVRNITGRFSNLKTRDGILTCNINSLSAIERSGADLRMLTGKFYLGPQEAGMDDMFLQEGDGTFLRASHLSFHYGDQKNLEDWVNKVVMDVTFTGTEFEFHTIRHYTPAIAGNHLKLVLDGRVTGTVADIHADHLHVSLPDGNTGVDLNLELCGIPDMPNTTISGTVSGVTATMPDVVTIASDWSGNPRRKELEKLAVGEMARYRADIGGPFRNMHVRGDMHVAGGTFTHDVHLHMFASESISVDGTAAVSNVDLSRITGVKTLGPADVKMGGSLSVSIAGGNTVTLDSLAVDGLEVNGYRFSDILARGKMKDGVADLRVVSHDDALELLAHLQADFTDGQGWKNIGMFFQVPYADLEKMHLVSGGGISRIEDVWGNARMNVRSLRDIFGEVRLRGLSYMNDRGKYVLDTLFLASDIRDGRYLVNLSTPVISGNYVGEDPVAEAVARMKDLLLKNQFDDVFPSAGHNPGVLDGPGNDSLILHIHTPQEFTDILSPGLFVSQNTSVTFSLREDDRFDMDFTSSRLAKNQNYLRNVDVRIDNPDSLLRVRFTCPEINFGGLNLTGNTLDLESLGGIIRMEYLFNNAGASTRTEMEFSSNVFFSRNAGNELQTNIFINESDCFLNGMKWHIPASDVIIGKKYLSSDGFRLYNDGQEISLQGVVSENPEDEMKLRLDRFDISMMDIFLRNKLNLGGDFTGDMTVRDLYGIANILMDLHGDNVLFHKNEVGQLDIRSKWDPRQERILLILNNKFRDMNPLNISGYYHPADRYLFMNLSLRDLALTYINPFLGNVVNVTGGTISGDISLQGPIDDLVITNEDTRFVNLSFSPVFTKVPYVMNGRMDFTENVITFRDIVVTDRNDHSAHLNGSISHNFFKDMNMDLSLSFRDFDLLDTRERDLPAFYGKVTGNGYVTVKGPLENLELSALFENGIGTNVHIPLSNAYSASVRNLLSFKNYEVVEVDPYEQFLNRMRHKEKSNSLFTVYAHARLNDDALISVDIDKSMGNVINCRGAGNVELYLNPSNSTLDVRGDYVLSGGDVHYSVAGLLNKNFTLDDGGTIKFNGPVSSTTLNLGATYRTKASVSTLLADTTSVGTRQTVLCGVKVRGPLANPRISFSIDIPDLEPMTKGRVETALSSEAKMQQQFMSLMVTGGFMPDRQSGVENSNSILYSNAGEMVANQVNNIFRSLDIPLDMGLNYHKGNRRDMIDVNLSYQAFNNRLVLNGSVGNSQTSANWGGNFEAELKLDRLGKFRLSLFTKAPDQYKNILDNSQRTGFGFAFQSDFNRFVEVFLGRRKKEEYERKLMEEAERELLLESGQMPQEEK